MLNGNAREPSTRHLGRAFAHGAAILAFAAVMGSGLLKCPMALMLHVPCPACGSTRAARALLAFDLTSAVRFNPVAPIVLLALAGLAWRAVALAFIDGHARRIDEERIGRFLLRVVIWAVIAQTVVWIARFFGLFGGPCPV